MKKMIVGRDEMGDFARDIAGLAVLWQKHNTNKASGKAFVFGLRGDLGAGKTTFTQRFCTFFEVKDNVTSPTFVIQKIYKVGNPAGFGGIERIYHIDVYRLETSAELQRLGFERILTDPKAIIVVEWPEKVADLLPLETKYIDFTFIDENTRAVEYNWEND